MFLSLEIRSFCLMLFRSFEGQRLQRAMDFLASTMQCGGLWRLFWRPLVHGHGEFLIVLLQAVVTISEWTMTRTTATRLRGNESDSCLKKSTKKVGGLAASSWLRPPSLFMRLLAMRSSKSQRAREMCRPVFFFAIGGSTRG